MAVRTNSGTKLHHLVLQRLDRAVRDSRSCGHEYPSMGRYRYAIRGEIAQWLELLHHADLDPGERREVDEQVLDSWDHIRSTDPELHVIFVNCYPKGGYE